MATPISWSTPLSIPDTIEYRSSIISNSSLKRGITDDDAFSESDPDTSFTKQPRSRKCEKDPDVRFACPFVICAPRKVFPSCAHGWTTIARLKEHLLRRHKRPPSCQRCMSEFESVEQLQEHAWEARACEVAMTTAVDENLWLTDEAYEIIKRRARKGEDAVESWKHLYCAIMPGTSYIPSPYVGHHSSHWPGLLEKLTVQELFQLQDEVGRALSLRRVSTEPTHVLSTPLPSASLIPHLHPRDTDQRSVDLHTTASVSSAPTLAQARWTTTEPMPVCVDALPANLRTQESVESGGPAGFNPTLDSAAERKKPQFFFCTFCLEEGSTKLIKTKQDWKRHQEDYHDIGRQWCCRVKDCSQVFSRGVDYKRHMRTHGDKMSIYGREKDIIQRQRIYACGFEHCRYTGSDWKERCDHVAACMQRNASPEWSFTRSIRNLLRQDKIAPTWRALKHLKAATGTQLIWDVHLSRDMRRQLEYHNFPQGLDTFLEQLLSQGLPKDIRSQDIRGTQATPSLPPLPLPKFSQDLHEPSWSVAQPITQYNTKGSVEAVNSTDSTMDSTSIRNSGMMTDALPPFRPHNQASSHCSPSKAPPFDSYASSPNSFDSWTTYSFLDWHTDSFGTPVPVTDFGHILRDLPIPSNRSHSNIEDVPPVPRFPTPPTSRFTLRDLHFRDYLTTALQADDYGDSSTTAFCS